MPYTPIPQPILQADLDDLKTAIMDAITKAQAMNNTNTALTKGERSSGVTVGQQRKAFNDYYYGNKNSYPDFKPGQTSVSEANADKHFFIHNGLTESAGLLLSLLETVQDMQLNSEHFSYDYARSGRDAAKNARDNGLPGADSWFDSLDELFPQSPGPSPAPDVP
jgi:hypothetical protein